MRWSDLVSRHLRYIEPHESNELALGLDVASEPARLQAIEKARDTGEMFATSRIRLVQSPGDEAGVLVFLPIYRSGVSLSRPAVRRATLMGFAVGVFRISHLVEASLRGLDRDKVGFSLHDESAAAGEDLLNRTGVVNRAQAGGPFLLPDPSCPLLARS